MSGMAAAFSALFGTPMAAAFLPWRFPAWGSCTMRRWFPASVRPLVANDVAKYIGVQTENFHVMNDLELSLVPGLKVVLLAACCAMLSILFCMMLQMGRFFLRNILVTCISGSARAASFSFSSPSLSGARITLARACRSLNRRWQAMRCHGLFFSNDIYGHHDFRRL